MLGRKEHICSSSWQPSEVLLLRSQLKPVAACALGYPETGEMFVIATEDAGDATGLESAIARLLGNAVYQLLSYIAQKAMMLDNNVKDYLRAGRAGLRKKKNIYIYNIKITCSFSVYF